MGQQPVNEDWHARCQALAWASKLRTGRRCTASSRARCQRPRCSVQPCRLQGRSLSSTRENHHQQRAQNHFGVPLNALEAALKTVGDNGEHELASSQASHEQHVLNFYSSNVICGAVSSSMCSSDSEVPDEANMRSAFLNSVLHYSIGDALGDRGRRGFSVECFCGLGYRAHDCTVRMRST